MTTILVIDLDKRHSVTRVYGTTTGKHTFGKVDTTPAAMHDLLVASPPDRRVTEVGSRAGEGGEGGGASG